MSLKAGDEPRVVVTVNEMRRWKWSGRGLEEVKVGGECLVCNPRRRQNLMEKAV